VAGAGTVELRPELDHLAPKDEGTRGRHSGLSRTRSLAVL